MGLFSKKGKVRDNYLRMWAKTIEDYNLKIPLEKYRHIAQALGKAEGGGFLSNLFSGGGILGFLGSLLGVGLTFLATGGTGFLFYSAVAAAAVGGVGVIYGAYINMQSKKIQANLSSIKSHSAMLKEKQETYAKGDRLTEYIAYTDYQIYATGSIYSKNQPGSQTYSPSLAYDTSKGIYANEKFNEIDEQTQGRAHFTSAGNKGYMQAKLETPFNLAQGGLSLKQIQDSLENNIRKNNRRIVDGFSILAQQKMNFTNELASIYEWVINQQIHPLLKKACNNDFLDKMQNYNRALRADFEYIFLSTFTKQKEDKRDKEKRIKDKLKQDLRLRNHLNDYFKGNMWFLDFLNAYEFYYYTNISPKFSQGEPVLNRILKQNLPLKNVYQGRTYEEKFFFNGDLSGGFGFGKINKKYLNLETFEDFKKAVSEKDIIFLETYKTTAYEQERGHYEVEETRLIVLSLEILDELIKDFKAKRTAELKDEIADEEYKILQEKFYKQKSRLYTLEEKAIDFLENIKALIMELNYSIEDKLYLTFENEEIEIDTESLSLLKSDFESLAKQTSTFYTLKDERLLINTEKDLISFENNNEIFNFYKNLNSFLGTLTQENKAFKVFFYENLLGFFREDREDELFNLIKEPLYYDKRLNNFDFNQVKAEFITLKEA